MKRNNREIISVNNIETIRDLAYDLCDVYNCGYSQAKDCLLKADIFKQGNEFIIYWFGNEKDFTILKRTKTKIEIIEEGLEWL